MEALGKKGDAVALAALAAAGGGDGTSAEAGSGEGTSAGDDVTDAPAASGAEEDTVASAVAAVAEEPPDGRTYVDDVFGGVFSNTVTCHVCETTSVTYEQFYDISLPLTHMQPKRGGGKGKKKNKVPPIVLPVVTLDVCVFFWGGESVFECVTVCDSG